MSNAAKRTSGTSRRPGVTPLDLDAFHRHLFLPLVRMATWKRGLSKEDARDVVQDAFVLALTKLRADGNPKAWLTRVVDGLALNLQRKNLRRIQLAAKWSSGCGEGRPLAEAREAFSAYEEDSGGFVE